MRDSTLSRKEKIMRVALSLFATNGYIDTSTKEISIEAGVSEALIFKHFGNKDALLAHIIKAGYRRVLSHHRGMMTYKDPKEFLKNMIFLPSQLVAEEPLFWKLQERLWHNTFSKQQHEQFMKPVQPILQKAFSELGYKEPELETQYLLLIIDMLWKREVSGDVTNGLELAGLLEQKYNLL
ncbi:TetR/AcrR family transcriptional regulator [Sphingobacterium psychroaquaticum]|uniref:Transcriptional regulator, TetR family n=1 Tax=Sphingobacterium psychroaquaticum TaxID=561061 RepID=A0A1X7KIB2_9SPHI|nr:TetR/AcrR family transcriptional regulator [Sphingobacterium psychroaquaticum]SMG40789.1 transcriptional regulator, TetR family [Sphingobacterium psychroaquaticum]